MDAKGMGFQRPGTHNLIKKRGTMFNSKKPVPSKPRTRASYVGVTKEIYGDLKIFLKKYADHADPEGPVWTLTRFISQAITEKITREQEKNILSPEEEDHLKLVRDAGEAVDTRRAKMESEKG